MQAKSTFAALVCAALFGAIAADAHAITVKVRGSARISARITRTRVPATDGGAPERAVLIEGTLEDDVGSRLADERIYLRAASATDERKVRFEDAATATSCDPGAPPLRRDVDAVVTTTDASGRFCVRLVLPLEHYRVSLASAGTPLMDPATSELGVDLGRRSVSVRFDGTPRRLSLDKEEHTIIGVASIEDEEVRVAAELLPLTLVTSAGTIIGTEVTGPSGQASFRVPSGALGEPGLGELRLTFPGDDGTASATASMPIEKRARVTMSLAKPIEPTSTPEDGVPIEVALSSRTTTVPAGIVEARVGDSVVGAAPVRDGRARFAATFAMPDRGDVVLSLRFVPEAPWWEAPDALSVRVPLVGVPPWRKAPLVLAGILVALFVVLGRLGRVRSVPRAPKAARTIPPLRAGVAVIEPRDARSGWSGRVLDAHERTPVVGARVLIESSDFQGTEVLASTFVGEEGEFTLPAVRAAGRAHILVDAPLHSSLKKALPPAGVLEIAMVSRKRALLDRLVEWARIRGKPFDARPEPTPAHVRKVATPDSAPARWADAVESAAFGADPVDGRVEAEIDALRPDSPANPPLPVGQTRER